MKNLNQKYQVQLQGMFTVDVLLEIRYLSILRVLHYLVFDSYQDSGFWLIETKWLAQLTIGLNNGNMT